MRGLPAARRRRLPALCSYTAMPVSFVYCLEYVTPAHRIGNLQSVQSEEPSSLRTIVGLVGATTTATSVERPAIDANGGDAGRQSRRFHAEQFRCTAWPRDLSVGLL